MTPVWLQMIWIVPCYALVGALITAFWSPGLVRHTGPRPAGYINTLMTFLAFSHSVLALRETWNQPPQQFSFSWLHAASLEITFDVSISSVTVGALALVTGLNLLAQVYAIGYLEMDWGWARFYALLALFEAGICTLVLCNSLFFSYVMLEILTLGTYLIVGYWFNQPLVVTGARDAFLTKRVGDLFLLMGVVALWPLAGTWNFDRLAVWAENATLDPTTATLLSLALIAGPIGKCAQFPLHLWLDEAMEGPVPATILRNGVVVATGAWVLIKVQPILALSPVGLTVVTFVGAVTAVGAASIAIAQTDLKRVLSYAVSAYMGLGFVAVGTGQEETALQLLFTYAIAMALLVMAVGGIILSNITQDVTQYGGLWSRRPISGFCFLIGAAALVALPPLGNFWTLAEMANHLWQTQPWLLGAILVVNAFTAFSLTRVFCLMFCGQPQAMTYRSPEGLWLLTLPMTFLAGFALHVPLLLWQWHLLPVEETFNSDLATLLVFSTVEGIALAALIYLNPNWRKPVRFAPQVLQDFFAYDFYTAKIYRFTVVLFIDLIARLVDWFDRYVVDSIVNLVGLVTVFSGQTLRYNTSGQTQFYVLTIILGLILMGFATCWPLFSPAF